MKTANKYIIILIIWGFFISVALEAQQIDTRPVTVNFPDSIVKTNVLTRNGDVKPKKKLVYYWYYNDQIKCNQGGYSYNLLTGSYKVFDHRMNMLVSGYFEKGLKHGTWKKWDERGSLLRLVHWKNGVLDGWQYFFSREDGSVIRIKYRKGKRIESKNESREGFLDRLFMNSQQADSTTNDDASNRAEEE